MTFARDSSFSIDFEEFLTLMRLGNDSDSEEDDMIAAFREFDLNGDCFIDKEELKKVMSNLGEDLTEADLKKMMSNADGDGDGQVDYAEFVKMMRAED